VDALTQNPDQWWVTVLALLHLRVLHNSILRNCHIPSLLPVSYIAQIHTSTNLLVTEAVG
jgi:hypothetical protein